MLEFLYKSSFHGEMDITTVFGTVVPGSNPGGSTNKMVTFFWLPQEVTFVTSVRIRWAQRYEATKPNRERRAASLFYDGKIRLVAEIPGGLRYTCNECG